MFSQMQAKVAEILVDPMLRAVAIVLVSVLVALLARVILSTVVPFFTRKTKTEIDDQIVLAFRQPIFVSVVLAGIAWAFNGFTAPTATRFVIFSLIKTLLVFSWASALMKIGKIFLETLSRHAGKLALVQPRTVPLFDILVKVVVVGGAAYFALLAWNINVTGWLASAGVVGIAVGFAAKDTLANLFAGIFILADAPYKLGDFIILDNGERGQVTDIGIRSTRILTRDDVEVTVPNAVIANSKIINETGGPHEKERVGSRSTWPMAAMSIRCASCCSGARKGSSTWPPSPRRGSVFGSLATRGSSFS